MWTRSRTRARFWNKVFAPCSTSYGDLDPCPALNPPIIIKLRFRVHIDNTPSSIPEKEERGGRKISPKHAQTQVNLIDTYKHQRAAHHYMAFHHPLLESLSILLSTTMYKT